MHACGACGSLVIQAPTRFKEGRKLMHEEYVPKTHNLFTIHTSKTYDYYPPGGLDMGKLTLCSPSVLSKKISVFSLWSNLKMGIT